MPQESSVSTIATTVFQTPAASLISLVAVVAFSLMVKVTIPVTYQTNDDPGMSMLFSGCGYAAHPDFHSFSLFTNLIIGKLITQLYLWQKGIPWYGLYIFAANIIGLYAITFSLLYRKAKNVAAYSILIFYSAIGISNFCMLQFTTASCLLSLGAFSLLLTWWEQFLKTSTSKHTIFLILSSTIFFIASLMRIQSYELIALLSALTLLIRASGEWRNLNKSIAIRCGLPFLILATITALALGANYLDRQVYKNAPGWNECYEALYIQQQFSDFNYGQNANEKQLKQLLEKTCWSPNDLAMFQNLFHLDSDFFSLQRMKEAARLFEKKHVKSWQETLVGVRNAIFDKLTLVPICWVLMSFLLPSTGFSNKQRLALGICIFGLMTFMSAYLKLPVHVYVPISGFYLFVTLFYLEIDKIERFSTIKVCSLIAVFLALTSYSFHISRANGYRVSQKNLLFRKALTELAPKKTDLYITWRDSFPAELVLPLDDIHSYFGEMNILPLAFRANSPVCADMLKQHDMNTTNFGSAITRSNVFLISAPDLNPLMISYLWEHYHLLAKIEPFKNFYPLRFAVYKVTIPTLEHETSSPKIGFH